MIKGIDISHQDNINWNTISGDIEFVIHKATQGSTFIDPQFNSRWQKLKSTPLIRGAYLFLNWQQPAIDQVNNFLSLGIDFTARGCLPPFLDIEDAVPASGNQYIKNNPHDSLALVTEVLQLLEQKTGRTPIIYTYKNFLIEYLPGYESLSKYQLWLAAYQPQQPSVPTGWNDFLFWQWSEYGQQNGSGTGGNLDMDYFNGDINQLNSLANINNQ